jgi:5-methylcytosine-specific restriction endonuclease McrA
MTCPVCGLTGKFFAIETTDTKEPKKYHLNLYAVENGQEVLMTSDHIFPKSLGGRGHLKNRQAMCSPCNSKKGSYYENPT